MGDGEIQEGSIWEAAGCAGKHQLGNLCAIVDYNGIQSAGRIADVQPLEPLAEKWRAFGWEIVEIQGHMVGGLRSQLKRRRTKPTVVVCHTIKGRGIGFAEGDPKWHHRSEIGPELVARLRTALHEQEAAVA
jgi:transketolase